MRQSIKSKPALGVATASFALSVVGDVLRTARDPSGVFAALLIALKIRERSVVQVRSCVTVLKTISVPTSDVLRSLSTLGADADQKE